MNKLQAIPLPGEPGSPGRVLVTMNPIRIPRSVHGCDIYHHPLISSESILMARHLHLINGVAKIGFAGAWMGFGFHEDGFVAGVHAARTAIDGWDRVPPLDLTVYMKNERMHRTGFVNRVLRLGVLIVQQTLQRQGRIVLGLSAWLALIYVLTRF